MAEILLRVKPHPGANEYLFRVGDALAWHDNGAEWSARELTNPHWRIIQVNGLSTEQIDSFMARALSADPNIEPKGRRGQYIDINDGSITGALRTWLDDDTRAEPIFSMSKNEALALVRIHPVENQ
jgi:hypothetical protein